MIKQITQSIIMIMHPAEPLLEWIAELGVYLKEKTPPENPFTEDLASATVVYIPKNPDLAKFNEFLIRHSETLLNYEFSRWTQDEEKWPLGNNAEILLEYFRLELYDNIVDLRKNETDSYRVAILKPTTKLKTWLKRILTLLGEDTSQIDFTSPDSFQSVSTAVLFSGNDAEVITLLHENWASLFEYELNRYVVEEKYWPENRSNTLFWEWFEVDLYTAPYLLKS